MIGGDGGGVAMVGVDGGDVTMVGGDGTEGIEMAPEFTL